MSDVKANLIRIADACRRPNGEDISLGEQCREAHDTIATLEARIAELGADLSKWSDYSIDLQRFIEALCEGRPIPTPITAARFHYQKAVAATEERKRLPQDVVNLVNAARLVVYEDQSAEALETLDIAAEAFASRVPWDDEPPEAEAIRDAARSLTVAKEE